MTIVKHLRAISTSPSLAETNVQHFLDGLVFNYLIGAPDAHAKNYSVLIAPDVVVFAPLYDIASALPYDSTSQHGLKRAAMKIASENRFGEITPRHWSSSPPRRAPIPSA